MKLYSNTLRDAHQKGKEQKSYKSLYQNGHKSDPFIENDLANKIANKVVA